MVLLRGDEGGGNALGAAARGGLISIALSLSLVGLANAEFSKKIDGRSNQNSDGQTEQRGSETSPIVVKIQGGPDAKKAADEHASDIKRHDTDQGWAIGIGIVTSVAAIAQVLVLFGQILYLRRTVRDSERAIEAATAAANAATLQARILQATEASELIIAGMNLIRYPDAPPGMTDNIIPPGPLTLEKHRIVITIKNVGRTRARITDFCVEWIIEPKPDPNKNPDPSLVPVYSNVTQTAYVIDRDEIATLKWGAGEANIVTMTRSERDSINNNTAWLWVYGKLTSVDFLGDEWEVAFIGHWEAVAGGTVGSADIKAARGFVIEGPSPYHFRRRLEPQR